MKYIRELVLLIIVFFKVRKINKRIETIKTDDIIARSIQKERNKMYKFHNEVISDLMVEHEKAVKRIVSDIKKVHEIEINRMIVSHEKQVDTYRNIIREITKERDEMAKDNCDVVSFFSELIPRMTMLKEKESALARERLLRQARDSKKDFEISEEWSTMNRIMKKNEKKINNLTKDPKIYDFFSNKIMESK